MIMRFNLALIFVLLIVASVFGATVDDITNVIGIFGGDASRAVPKIDRVFQVTGMVLTGAAALAALDPGDDRWETFGAEQGLSELIVRRLHPDERGLVWLAGWGDGLLAIRQPAALPHLAPLANGRTP